MSTLKDLKKSISEMTEEELMERMLELRKQRRAVISFRSSKKKSGAKPATGKAAPAKEMNSLISQLQNLSPEQLQALLAKAK